MARAVYGISPGSEVMAKSEQAARKSVALDPTLAEGHTALAAWYLCFAWDPKNALAEADRAIALNPHYSPVRFLRTRALIALGRNEEAIQDNKIFMELDPLVFGWSTGEVYLLLGQVDKATSELEARVRQQPDDSFTHFTLAECYWLQKNWNGYMQETLKNFQTGGEPFDAASLTKASETSGQTATTRWVINYLLARSRGKFTSSWDIANEYAYLGDREQTLKYLEKSYEEHYPFLILLENEPFLNFLHSDPRYQALVRKVRTSFTQ